MGMLEMKPASAEPSTSTSPRPLAPRSTTAAYLPPGHTTAQATTMQANSIREDAQGRPDYVNKKRLRSCAACLDPPSTDTPNMHLTSGLQGHRDDHGPKDGSRGEELLQNLETHTRDTNTIAAAVALLGINIIKHQKSSIPTGCT